MLSAVYAVSVMAQAVPGVHWYITFAVSVVEETKFFSWLFIFVIQVLPSEWYLSLSQTVDWMVD